MKFNFDSDNIYQKMRNLGFTNYIEDRVKLVYVPCYLNGTDGVFNMSYYELIPGLDLSVFASYYEPWGYTPLESVAFGVPTITTDLAGFGLWVKDEYGDKECGVKVLHRTDSNYDELVHGIADTIEGVFAKSQSEIKTIRAAAQKVSKNASWDNFMKYYQEAYDVALKNAKNRNK